MNQFIGSISNFDAQEPFIKRFFLKLQSNLKICSLKTLVKIINILVTDIINRMLKILHLPSNTISFILILFPTIHSMGQSKCKCMQIKQAIEMK